MMPLVSSDFGITISLSMVETDIGRVGKPNNIIPYPTVPWEGINELDYTLSLASFPGPAQLSVACSTEKRGEPGIFSHVSMT